jgi:hypothetical protein
MSNPDRTLLDQINDTWDARNQGTTPVSVEYADTIDALHQAGAGAKPTAEFRARLRERLSATSARTADSGGDVTFSAEERQGAPAQLPAQRAPRDGEVDAMDRRRWFSHIGELAAMILILVVAVAAVAFWQSDDERSFLPGSTGDDEDNQVEPIPTPEQNEPGIWTDLTFDEAQSITPFNLFMPENVPDGYELDSIMVMNMSEMAASEDFDLGEREDGDPFMTVVFEFPNDEGQFIELVLQNLTSPGLVGDEPKQPPTDSTPGTPEDLSRGEIDGAEVMSTRYLHNSGQHERMLYVWFQDGLTINVTFPGLTGPEPAFMEMVESIIASRENEEQPPVAHGFESEDESSTGSEDSTPIEPPEYHHQLSIDEAQEIVPFELIDPRDAHEDYELTGVTVAEPALEGEPYHVSFSMLHRTDGTRGFEIYQQDAPSGTPSISTDDEPIGVDDEAEDIDTPDPVQEEIEIDGLSVMHTVNFNNGDQITAYTWAQDATGLAIYAVTEVHEENRNNIEPEWVVPENDLRDIVTALIESRTSDEAPPEPDTGSPPADTPTPQDGGRQEVSYSEADERTSFDVIDTDLLPGELRFALAELLRSEDGQPVDGDHPEVDSPNQAHIYFTSPPGADVPYSLEIVQTTDSIPNPEGEMLEIAGHPVEYVSGTMGTSFQAGWIWEVGDVEHGILITTIDGEAIDAIQESADQLPVSDDRVRAIIASTLE